MVVNGIQTGTNVLMWGPRGSWEEKKFREDFWNCLEGLKKFKKVFGVLEDPMGSLGDYRDSKDGVGFTMGFYQILDINLPSGV